MKPRQCTRHIVDAWIAMLIRASLDFLKLVKYRTARVSKRVPRQGAKVVRDRICLDSNNF